MKIFVYEHTSGGGYAGRSLPPARLRRGELMHGALLADLADVAGIGVLTTRDVRLPATMPLAAVQSVAVERQSAHYFDDCMAAADAVWLVAPVAGGVLEAYARRVLAGKRVLLCSRPAVVRLCGDKPALAMTLAAAGIAVAATYAGGQPLPPQGGAWVVRPGPEATIAGTWLVGGTQRGLVAAPPPATVRSVSAPSSPPLWAAYTVQAFVPGRPCSLCVLCCDGAALVLSCNAQRVAVRDGQLHLLGSTVNGVADEHGYFAGIARQIAACLPGLWGYVGIDVVLTPHQLVVLDVYPCMTPEWSGVRASIACNPAQLVLGLLSGGLRVPAGRLQAAAVSVDHAMFDH